jgi:phosphoserine aminotransferase
MLCVADYLDALSWVREIGGSDAVIAKSQANFKVISDFVTANDWIDFLAVKPTTQSNTSVCLTLNIEAQQVKAMVSLLDAESVAYDIGAYRDAPAGLRIWCGATVEEKDLQTLIPWLLWAYQTVVQ